ncbi:MAG TPA: protein kinase [Planctomycetaceae bacterium]|jgi:WD40 repeat protein|nr:protein kinase [Planctomycetaceae bacterium]
MSDIPSMACPTGAELAALVQGRLSVTRHDELEKHLRDCETCQIALATLDDRPVDLHSLLRDVFGSATVLGISSPDQELDCSRASAERSARSAGPWRGVCPACLVELEANQRPANCPSCGAVLGSNTDLTQTESKIDLHDSTFSVPDEFLSPQLEQNAFETIGRYRFVRNLDGGGFGSVYLALDEQLKRLVAIKIPHKRLGQSLSGRFAREYRNAAQLHHPNIVALYDVGEYQGAPYLVYEFVDGVTLKHVVREGSASRRESTRIVAEVAGALEYAHSKNVVHRDVKSANIMLDRSGRARLMDFGLAKREAHDEDLTATGAVMGTIPYMSPEQAAGRLRELGPESDVYSLGIVLYELLTGTLPFRGTTELVIRQICDTAPPKPSSVNPLIERDLETICLTAIAKSPSDRYQRAGAFGADLTHWLNGEPIDAVRPSLAKRLILWRRRQPTLANLLLTVAALLMLMILGSTYGFFFQSRMRQNAENLLHERNRLLAHQYSENGIRSFDLLDGATEQDVVRGLPWMVEALAVAGGDDPRYEATERLRVASLFRAAPRLLFLAPLHQDSIESCTLSQDSQRLLTTGDDGLACVTDIETGNPVVAPFQHGSMVTCGDFHSNGRLVATGTADGIVRTWDLDAGNEPRRLPLEIHSKQAGAPRISCLKFSRDGRYLAIGDGAGVVTLLRVGSEGKPVGISTFGGNIASIDFTVDSKLLVAASADSVARVFECEPWKMVTEYGQRGAIRQAFFSFDGARVVSASSVDSSVYVWTARKGELIYPPLADRGGGPSRVALSPDSKVLVTADRDTGRIQRWHLDAEKPFGEVITQREGILDIAFSATGSMLATAGRDGGIRLYDAANLQRHGPLVHLAEKARWVRFTHDDRKLLVSTEDGSVRCFELPWSRPARRLSHESEVAAVAISADARRLATAGAAVQDPILVTDISDGVARPTGVAFLESHGPVRAIAFSNDGTKIASGGDDSFVQIWDSSTGHLLAGPLVHPEPVSSVRFSADGRQLVAVTLSGQAILWNLDNDKPWAKPLAHGPRVREICFDDADRLVSTIGGTKAMFWYLANGDSNGSFIESKQTIVGAQLLSPGKRLLVATLRSCVLWDREKNERIAEVAHGGAIGIFVASPSGALFVTAGEDNLARIWRAESLQYATPTLRHASAITDARFSEDDQFLATATRDGAVRVWDTLNGLLVAPPVMPLDHRLIPMITDPQTVVGLFFTKASDQVCIVRRSAEIQFVSLKSSGDSAADLRAAATAQSGYEVDQSGGFVPAGRATLLRVALRSNRSAREPATLARVHK